MAIKSNYKSELEKNGVIAFVPSGNSMWPIIKNKSQSVIVHKKEKRLTKHDVAFYERANGTFVLHRVLEVTDNGYVCCGDSQNSLEKVNEEQVFGVMLGFYRGKKYVESSNEKYIKSVERWYKRKTWRKIRLKCFYFSNKVKNKLKKLFKKERKDV